MFLQTTHYSKLLGLTCIILSLAACQQNTVERAVTVFTNTPQETEADQTNTTEVEAEAEAETSLRSSSATQAPLVAKNYKYNWLPAHDAKDILINRIPVPPGFERIKANKNTYADWLRQLPLLPNGTQVQLYNGQLKSNQSSHHAVVNIEIGNKDLQQCADAVMRLRAEYLYQQKQYDKIHFNYTSGDKVSYNRWRAGERPKISGNKVNWVQQNPNDSYSSFKSYLMNIFMYAGTLSLEKELKRVSDVANIQIGDVFIQGGSPGHAMLVADVAQNTTTGETLFLLLQSYMPAQSMHIVKNPNDKNKSPWFSTNFGDTLYTPDWTFSNNDLKRFP